MEARENVLQLFLTGADKQINSVRIEWAGNWHRLDGVTYKNEFTQEPQELSDVRRMSKRSSSTGTKSCGGWMPEFVSKIAPPFVPRSFEMQDGSSERFEWLAKKNTIEELWVCATTQHRERKQPLEGKRILLHIFDDILSNGDVPGSWQRTKIIPILKPGKDSSNSDSYWPISMLPCGRKRRENYSGMNEELSGKIRNYVHGSMQYGLVSGRAEEL
jgi:hypothetical protein